MRTLRTYSMAAAMAAVLIGGGLLQAQPSDDGAAGEQEARQEVAPATEADEAAAMSPQEMQADAGRLLQEMQDMRTRVVAVRDDARKKKDVIRLDCVEDKLRRIEQLLIIAETARAALAAAAGDTGDAMAERRHQHSRIAIAREKTGALRDEADTCVGEELVFPGATDVDMDAPTVADDPTQEPPFDLPGEPPIERPDPATPFV